MTSIVDDLIDLYPDEVTLEAPLAPDWQGAVSGWDTPQTAKARVSQSSMAVRDRDGVEVTSAVQAHLAGVFGADVTWRFTLPVRFNPRRPMAINVYHGTDEDGAHHETVYFK